tara:strand:- start:91 stop:339 length:249 start_codon:yes stop_codon:yes gene_type:complete
VSWWLSWSWRSRRRTERGVARLPASEEDPDPDADPSDDLEADDEPADEVEVEEEEGEKDAPRTARVVDVRAGPPGRVADRVE